MPTIDIAKSRTWCFCVDGAAAPGRYMARRPITEVELRRTLCKIFRVAVLPPTLVCWPDEGTEVTYATGRRECG